MFSSDFSSAVNILDSATSKQNTLFEIIEYKKPRKMDAYNVMYNNQSVNVTSHQYVGEKLRQVRINLNGGAIITQPGALHFMKGPIQMEVNSNLAQSVKGFFKSIGTGESSVTPRYVGKEGEIYLEPSYKYFYMLEMNNDEIVLDDGMFYCCEDTIELSVHTNKNIASGLFGGDGFKQPKLTGSGLAVLESDVPFEEVLIYELNNETLKVDGNFAIVIRGNIESRIEKSSKSLMSTIKSGEGLLQTFTGTGEVWIAPTRRNLPLNF